MEKDSVKSTNRMEEACEALKRAKDAGYGIIVLTGAGMSVLSGVPVFRSADGSMSEEFLAFLDDYNNARLQHGLPAADDWFDFSVPEMFRAETAREAWAYWRWRMLRALVQPGADYRHLSCIIESFGRDKAFVVTSNCDGLHRGFVDKVHLLEIHGSLTRVQCSNECSQQLWPVDETFLSRLREDSDWVPMCPNCEKNCLRPNVMIFGDHKLVESELDKQSQNFDDIKPALENNWIVLEVGAGVVVPSIRYQAEALGSQGSGGLIRINPSENECSEMQTSCGLAASKNYWPISEKASFGLKCLAEALDEA